MIRTVTSVTCDACQATGEVDSSGLFAIRALRVRGWILAHGEDYCSEACQQRAQTGPAYPDNPSMLWHSKAVTEEQWNESRASFIADGWQMRYPPSAGMVYLRKPYNP